MLKLDPVRRALLVGGASLALLAGLGRAAAAVSVDQAQDFVEETIAELFAIARSGADLPDQRRAFRELLARRMAVNAVARTILGPTWRAISEAQRQAYLDAFQDYVAQKYGSRFDEFTQVKMEIIRATDRGDRGVVVESRALLPNGETALVDWGVSDRGGQILISNIVVEGVSLVTSEREIVAGMLDRSGGNVERLIADLKAKGA
ncbi:MAG TPA: ABC transporter substrate-binding protein [Paracoccaceae bacterium]|nr:ABC transporter substrate-binding protein [Paracoccaceae bacterium]